MPIFCSSCEASNPRSARFCEACGAAISEAGGEGAAPPRPRTRRPRQAHQIGSGLRAVRDVRAWFALFGGFCLLLFGLLLLQLGSEDIEQSDVVIALVLVGLPMLVCFGGVAFARRSPLPWALALAAFLTLNVTWAVAQWRFPGILNLLAMLSAWGLLGPILRLRRLAAESPDEPALVTAAVGAPRPSASRRRARKNLLGDFRTAALLLVGFLVLLFGGGWAIAKAGDAFTTTSTELRAEQPTEPLAPVLDRFEAAWRSGVESLQPFYLERLRSRAKRLQTRFDRRGLQEPLPALGERVARNSGRYQQTATWRSPIGDIVVVFEFEDGKWGMVALRLP